MYNGNYNPENGRPTNLVGDIREKMNPVRNDVYRERGAPVPQVDITDKKAWQFLDELDVSLQELKEQIDLMNNMLSGVLRPDYEDGPVPGPRVSSSNLTSRIAAQADFVDDLTRTICNIRDRLSV